MSAAQQRTKKIHPADLHDLVQIGRATRFVAFFRKSPAEAYREQTSSIADARAILATLEAAHGQNGRRGAVYAITPENARIFVPDGYRPASS